jgi:hypothetical protein
MDTRLYYYIPSKDLVLVNGIFFRNEAITHISAHWQSNRDFRVDVVRFQETKPLVFTLRLLTERGGGRSDNREKDRSFTQLDEGENGREP